MTMTTRTARSVAALLLVSSSLGQGGVGRTQRDFETHIPRCGAGGDGIISGFLANDSPEGQYIDASQLTEAALCFTDEGLEVSFVARERNTFSDADQCNAPVWALGNAMELFIAPVRAAWDNPAEYHEIDGSPPGALWGACIDAEDVCPGCANATERTCQETGAFDCEGECLGRFTNGVVGVSDITEDGWELRLQLPWNIFAEWARPTVVIGSVTPWPHWRINLYRYSYYRGTGPEDFELDAWSPTHSSSFHDPRRFGFATMGDVAKGPAVTTPARLGGA